MMRLLLDQGLPRTATTLLKTEGIDAVHTGEIGLSTATDEAIIARAKDESRVVVTYDADFHSLLALSGASQPSVIRIRIEGLRSRETTELLVVVINTCRGDLEAGAAVTVQEHRVRVRRLPLI